MQACSARFAPNPRKRQQQRGGIVIGSASVRASAALKSAHTTSTRKNIIPVAATIPASTSADIPASRERCASTTVVAVEE